MSFIKKVSLINIFILLSFSTFSRIYIQSTMLSGRYGANYEPLGVMMMILFLLTFQIIVNGAWGLVLIFSKESEKKEKGKVFLLNSLLLLLIGFPTCFGAGSIFT